MRIDCKGYYVETGKNSFSIYKNDILWVKLPIASQVNANGETDRDTYTPTLQSEKVGDKHIFTWSTASSLWWRKQYILEVAPTFFLFKMRVNGTGSLDSLKLANIFYPSLMTITKQATQKPLLKAALSILAEPFRRCMFCLSPLRMRQAHLVSA